MMHTLLLLIQCLLTQYSDVADKKSALEIAAIIERTHGVKPKLERLGSLVELYEKMTALRAEFPDGVFKYMAK